MIGALKKMIVPLALLAVTGGIGYSAFPAAQADAQGSATFGTNTRTRSTLPSCTNQNCRTVEYDCGCLPGGATMKCTKTVCDRVCK